MRLTLRAIVSAMTFDALSTLTTDTPDLATLINCIDKIIFAKADGGDDGKLTARKSHVKEEQPDNSNAATTSIEIDVEDIKEKKKKYRLRHSDDLAYLLDVLIYHLRIDSDGTTQEIDNQGRNEEEQIGADDEEETKITEVLGEDKGKRILELCHRKVRTLVRRMTRQLETLNGANPNIGDIVVRLTGVLAALRQLRQCDGKVTWVQRGETTFPLEDRHFLLRAVLETLVEGKSSLLDLDSSLTAT